MLSVCGTIYLNPNVVPFAQSILDRASDPDGIEFVITEDEAGSDLMAQCFDKIRSMTKRLKVLPVPKEERLAHFEHCINFYERENIVPQNYVLEFRTRLSLYESGKIPRMWCPPAWNYNRSVAASSGDVILVTPTDLLCTFDLSRDYRRFKEEKEKRAHLCLLFGLSVGNPTRHHGTKMFNRTLYTAISWTDPKFSSQRFSYDARWLFRSYAEDEFNKMAEKAGAEARGWEERFGERRIFEMPASPWWPAYIFANPADNDYFVKQAKAYVRKGAP